MTRSCWAVVFVWVAVAAALFPVADATVAEGRTLLSIAAQWRNVTFPTWKPGGDPCGIPSWENVTCAGGTVVELNVSNRGIVGKLPEAIGDLTNLQVLDIGNIGGDKGKDLVKNAFTAPVPESLAKLTSLRVLNMSTIVWGIPFPLVVTKLANLEEFQMAEANLTGPLPPELFSMKKLRTLYIGGNLLTADLKDFAALTTLTELTFWGSNLNQTIPPEIANLTRLTYLNLHNANLWGGLPEVMGSMTSLDNLLLYSNSLSGRIPDSWKNLRNLSALRMDQLFLSGPFPTWLLTDLPYLQNLYLTDNMFYDDMPSLDLFQKFNLLRIDCNYMNGTNPYPSNPPSQFRTRYNCFNGATASDLRKVVTQCGVSHSSSDLDCSELYDFLAKGQCPPCPPFQFFMRGNGPSNPCICGFGGGPKSGKDSGVPVGAVVGGVVGLFVIFCIIVAFILWKRREQFAFLDKFKVKRVEEYGDWEIPQGVQRFTPEELARITNDFSDSHVIGVGGFGKVFYGSLDDGRMVAIKRASATSMQGVGEFRNEILLLSRLHHRHLVRLEGFCEDKDLQILVYEFMSKGNLHSHLLGKITSTPLHWYKRLEIAVGVAQGLEYLHSFADPPVIHRDVKPSNILLDEHMVAKLADFGISKATAEFDTHVSTRPAGTAGYLDPEYFLRRQLTTASDVYAFGVVLLELVTGQEAIDHKRDEEYNLIEWAKKRFHNGGIRSIIDPLIEYEYSRDAYTAMTELALRCTLFNKDERPSMKSVLAALEPHLAIQSLYSPQVLPSNDKTNRDKAKAESARPPPEPVRQQQRPNRGVYITFDSEYLDSSTPTEVQTNMGLVRDNLGPR